jgi:hypothetical protein
MKSAEQCLECSQFLAKIVALGAQAEATTRTLSEPYFDLLQKPADAGRWESESVFAPSGAVDIEQMSSAALALAGEVAPEIWENFTDLCHWAVPSPNPDADAPATRRARKMSAATLLRCSVVIALARAAGVPPSKEDELRSVVILAV